MCPKGQPKGLMVHRGQGARHFLVQRGEGVLRDLWPCCLVAQEGKSPQGGGEAVTCLLGGGQRAFYALGFLVWVF